MSKSINILVTGHRVLEGYNGYDFISSKEILYDLMPKTYKWLRTQLLEYINSYKKITAISGHADGVDQLFSCISLDLNTPLISVLPYKGFRSKTLFEKDILKRSKEVIYVNEIEEYKVKKINNYTPTIYYMRNKYMVDYVSASSGILLVGKLDRYKSGTFNTVRLASKTNLKIIKSPYCLI